MNAGWKTVKGLRIILRPVKWSKINWQKHVYSQGVKTRASAALCWRLGWAEPVQGVAESQFSFESQAMLMDENRPMLMYCIDVSFLLTNFFSPCYNINAVWNRLFVVVKVRSPCVQKTIIFNLRWCTNCKYCTNEMLSAAQLPPKRKENGLFGLQYMSHWFVFET